ncbi:hypothetical protein MBRA_52280 (plasmid) [Mycobacterium branderi]|uniref:RNA methyltransferase n=1 Tax=Mycobacterium branderi TaxID=43348 RepID=A0ABM7KVA6_9MYCO|nr:hypothetical protein MBRA_52280 [Mycobacterium branderi]
MDRPTSQGLNLAQLCNPGGALQHETPGESVLMESGDGRAKYAAAATQGNVSYLSARGPARQRTAQRKIAFVVGRERSGLQRDRARQRYLPARTLYWAEICCLASFSSPEKEMNA